MVRSRQIHTFTALRPRTQQWRSKQEPLCITQHRKLALHRCDLAIWPPDRHSIAVTQFVQRTVGMQPHANALRVKTLDHHGGRPVHASAIHRCSHQKLSRIKTGRISGYEAFFPCSPICARKRPCGQEHSILDIRHSQLSFLHGLTTKRGRKMPCKF